MKDKNSVQIIFDRRLIQKLANKQGIIIIIRSSEENREGKFLALLILHFFKFCVRQSSKPSLEILTGLFHYSINPSVHNIM